MGLTEKYRVLKNMIRGAVTKFPELWYSTVMVGHMTTLTQSPSKSDPCAQEHTCPIDPVIVGCTGGRLLLESSGVQPSH